MCEHSNESYSEQHLHVVLFIMMYMVIQTFKSVAETLVCDHSNQIYWAVQGGSNFNVCGWNSDRSIKAIDRTVYEKTKEGPPKKIWYSK